MRLYQLGDGTPEVAVVGSIHGDEPCGQRAIERLIAEEPDVERPVKLIVANDTALERNVRYVDEDLNRAFPGDPDADTHEGRLAHELTRELRDCTVFSLHSTQSYDAPFALVDTVGAVARAICPHLPVDVLVETGAFAGGRLIDHAHTIEVECGYQGSDAAAENAYDLVRAFLGATGVLSAPTAQAAATNGHADTDGSESPVDAGSRDEVTVYRMTDRIPKGPADDYEVFASNFERVQAGERFAAVDGDVLTADEAFYPILMSPYGYADVFGYAGERRGVLE